ncbi:MAG: ABC transporter permease [Actinomycetota bacterium]
MRHRHLLASLVRRQYQIRYRQSFAGFAWAVFPALTTLGAGTLVFHKVAGVDTGSTPYALFAMAALVPWTMFASGISLGVPSVVQAQLMVTRLTFPRAALPLSMVGTALIDFAVAAVLFAAFLVITRTGLHLTAVWFPVLMIIEIVLIAGVVLLGSALNVFARDVKVALPLITQLWLFLTPVMYPLESVPQELRSWYLLNPMTGLVESFRGVLVGGESPDPALLLPAIIGAVVALVIGVWYFAATESRFADVV